MEPHELINSATDLGNTIEVDRSFNIIFWILILVNLICLSASKSLNSSYLKSLFTTGIFNRQLLQNFQEELRLFSLSSFLLTLAYLNCLALILSMYFLQGVASESLMILGGVAVVLLLKFGVMWLTGFFAQSTAGIYEHFLNHLVYMQIAGIILTPLLIFTFYLPPGYRSIAIAVLAIITLLFLFIRELYSLARAVRSRISLLYIILYLCTLELLPLVLVIRAFVSE